MFFLLNYGLLVSAKLLAGASRPFTFYAGGKFVLVLVWLVELVILGLLLAFRAIREMLRLQQHTAALQEELYGAVRGFSESSESAFPV